MAKSRTSKVIGRTTNLTASRGNAGKNKAQSILRELRERGRFPDTIYGRDGSPAKMNAYQRRQWAMNASGRTLSSRWHVNFSRAKALDRTSTSGGIRRTLEGYHVTYTYS